MSENQTPNVTTTETLQREIEKLKLLLEQRDEKLDELIKANNNFRLLMLQIEGPVPVADTIYLAQLQQKWHSAPIETIVAFLELFEMHAKVFSDIVNVRRSRSSSKARAEERSIAMSVETERIRKKQKEEKENPKPQAPKFQSPEEKAIAQMAKSLKLPYDQAKKIFESMMPKTEK